jgi:hypothetical protein
MERAESSHTAAFSIKIIVVKGNYNEQNYKTSCFA